MLLKSLPADLFLHVVSLLEDTDRRGLCGWCTRLGAEAASASASAAARRRRSPPPSLPLLSSASQALVLC